MYDTNQMKLGNKRKRNKATHPMTDYNSDKIENLAIRKSTPYGGGFSPPLKAIKPSYIAL